MSGKNISKTENWVQQKTQALSTSLPPCFLQAPDSEILNNLYLQERCLLNASPFNGTTCYKLLSVYNWKDLQVNVRFLGLKNANI